MANRLKMAMIGSILTLRRQGLSGRRIAELLGVNRETVLRYLRLARATTGRKGTQTQPHEADVALHSPGSDVSNPAIPGVHRVFGARAPVSVNTSCQKTAAEKGARGYEEGRSSTVCPLSSSL